MKRRRSRTIWLVLTVVLAAGAVLGGRMLLGRLYPLAYRPIIERQAKENGLDPYLVAAVIRAESRFRPQATSHQGARGLMQVMPETGRWVAEQLGLPYDPEDLYDPEFNIRVGTWYLAALLQQFDQNLVLALAAYNGGQANVSRWVEERGWNGQEQTLSQIPFQETRYYVEAVLRDYKRYQWLYGDWRPANQGG